MRKKLVAIASFIIVILIMVLLVYVLKKDKEINDESKINIVTTIFPQYDFASHIGGDKVNVKLLIEAGVETHHYEPSAKDMITIVDDADLFIYLGEDLEPWSNSLIENLNNTECDVLNVSNNIDLIKKEEFETKHLNSEIAMDLHEEHEDHHEEIYDEHIWLSPQNAIIMINNILEELVKLDPENKDYYTQNAEEYKNEIIALDDELKNIVSNSARKEIAVGGEFAYSYLIDEFDLNFVSVYNNCGDGEDPSISKVKSVIDYINNHDIPVVYYEELSEGTIAKMISEETDATALLLYSLHNGTPGVDTYVSLFKKNIENLEKGLN